MKSFDAAFTTNRMLLCVLLVASFTCLGACHKQESASAENEAIQAAITQHLASVSGLNLNAMDMVVQNVAINGNQAQAQVEFHLKGSADHGGTMKVGYQLEKRGAEWTVTKSQPGAVVAAPDASSPQTH
jgi:hypothetical protein